MRVSGSLMFSACLATAIGVALVASLRISVTVFDPVGGRLFPLLVTSILLMLCVLLVIQELRAALATSSADVSRQDPDFPAIGGLFATFAALTALVALGVIGLAVGLAAIVLVGGGVLVIREAPSPVQWRQLRNPGAVLLLVSCAMAVGAHLVFERMLGLPLP